MKKLIISICIIFTTLISFTSCCDLYGETMYSEGISYEYSYLNRPVFFLNGSYFWYIFVNDSWVYRPIPREYWNNIHHFDSPRMFFPNKGMSKPRMNNGRFNDNVTRLNNPYGNRGRLINGYIMPQTRSQGQFQSSTRTTGRPQGYTPSNPRISTQRGSILNRGTFQQSGQRNLGIRR